MFPTPHVFNQVYTYQLLEELQLEPPAQDLDLDQAAPQQGLDLEEPGLVFSLAVVESVKEEVDVHCVSCSVLWIMTSCCSGAMTQRGDRFKCFNEDSDLQHVE